MVVLFAVTSFVTAALLFLVQPMVGKMVLPAFGGSPQVWTTAMLFFQVALLVGYGYTHLATNRLTPRLQPRLHLVLAIMPLVVLPIALDVRPSGAPGIAPSLELLAGLFLGVAAPFVLVATSGPLLQRWFSWTDHPRAHDPYFLYAAGNLGSMLGLLAYPLLLERWLDVPAQAWLWAAGYVVMLGLVGACAWVALRRAGDRATRALEAVAPTGSQAAPVTGMRRARWVLLAFVPSSLMLAVTTHVSTDVAAVPLLWIVPLALYLATFVVAFGGRQPVALRVATRLLPPLALLALFSGYALVPFQLTIVVQLSVVAVGGLVAHGQLAGDRPATDALTGFYLLIAIGGALGGIFNGIIAPLLFPAVWEHAITLAVAVALIIDWRAITPASIRTRKALSIAVAAVAAAAPYGVYLALGTAVAGSLMALAALAAGLLFATTRVARTSAFGMGMAAVALVPLVGSLAIADSTYRTFFGVHRILSDDALVILMHGTTLHGSQDLSADGDRSILTTYYHPDGPLGDLAANYFAGERVGVVGLGTGALAAYGTPGQTVVFHEIDPTVVDIAHRHFTYLADSDADIDIVLGDGRLTLEEVPPGSYGILVMDAFTSDAIPVHLLTIEALEGYLTVVGDGVVAVHISNRYLDLRPVLGGGAAAVGAEAVWLLRDPNVEHGSSGLWVALARDGATLDPLRSAGWHELDGGQPWTDRRSDLIAVLR
jgi:hypothetical protein